jgi:hypothetical protein
VQSSSQQFKSPFFNIRRSSAIHQANDLLLAAVNDENASTFDVETVTIVKTWSQNIVKRWITGLSLGAIGTVWIASGNGLFSLGFLVTSLIAQNEYYAMVRATGVYPAYKIGTVSSLVSFLSAAMFPSLHELVMPLSATLLMIWLLIFNKKSASIGEISTSLLGMFYIGYLPSFWVRLRALDDLSKIRFSNAISKALSQRWYDPEAWTVGAIVTWWTWTSIVFAGLLTLL